MVKPPIRKPKKKSNPLAQAKITYIDYKDTALLRKFISDRGKIRARRVTGVSSQQQRQIAKAIKNAREMALIPYTNRVTTQRGGRRDRDGDDRRGPRGDRPERSDREGRDEAAPAAAEFEQVDAPVESTEVVEVAEGSEA